MSEKTLGGILGGLGAVLLVYLLFAFANADFGPVDWSTAPRVMCAGFMAIAFIVGYGEGSDD